MEPKKYPFKKPNPNPNTNPNPNSNLTFKPRPRPGFQNSGRGGSNPKSQVICHNCGYKGHYASECRQPKIICYGCGKPGHMKPNYPNQSNNIPPAGGNRPPNAPIASQGRNFGRNDAGRKGKPFGKLNCTNVKEVIHSDQAVIGMLNISTYPGKVLFDTEATTSFISREFVDAYGMKCNKLAYLITILSAKGIILVTQIRKQQVLMICGNEYYADLYVIPMRDIAVILGMDWL
jgi:hypothetical protein